jgi:hypothetical protein
LTERLSQHVEGRRGIKNNTLMKIWNNVGTRRSIMQNKIGKMQQVRGTVEKE